MSYRRPPRSGSPPDPPLLHLVSTCLLDRGGASGLVRQFRGDWLRLRHRWDIVIGDRPHRLLLAKPEPRILSRLRPSQGGVGRERGMVFMKSIWLVVLGVMFVAGAAVADEAAPKGKDAGGSKPQPAQVEYFKPEEKPSEGSLTVAG